MWRFKRLFRFNPAIIRDLTDIMDSSFSFEGGLRLTHDLIQSGEQFSAILAFDDLTAYRHVWPLGRVAGLENAIRVDSPIFKTYLIPSPSSKSISFVIVDGRACATCRPAGETRLIPVPQKIRSALLPCPVHASADRSAYAPHESSSWLLRGACREVVQMSIPRLPPRRQYHPPAG
jgi:hypothetical protein